VQEGAAARLRAVTPRADHPFAPLEADELPDQRIDYAFLRPGQPALRVTIDSAALICHAVDGLDLSDQKAVMCDLRWTQKPMRQR